MYLLFPIIFVSFYIIITTTAITIIYLYYVLKSIPLIDKSSTQHFKCYSICVRKLQKLL